MVWFFTADFLTRNRQNFLESSDLNYVALEVEHISCLLNMLVCNLGVRSTVEDLFKSNEVVR